MMLCGICETPTHKEFCWRCEERANRLNRSINKKLLVKSLEVEVEVKNNET